MSTSASTRVCHVRWYARGQTSQMPAGVRQPDVYELRDGKIIRMTLGDATPAEALEAVALLE